MRDERLKADYNAILGAWNFLKHHLSSDKPRNDAFFDSMTKEASETAKKHGNSKFAVQLMVCMVEEVERSYREETYHEAIRD